MGAPRPPRPDRGRRLAAWAGLAVVGLVTAAGLGGADAQTATPPSTTTTTRPPLTSARLTVEPATGLEDQAVTASWSGFPKSKPNGLYRVSIFQCGSPDPQSFDECYQDPPLPEETAGNAVLGALTAEDGTGSVTMEVRTASKLSSLGCSHSHPCSLVAYPLGYPFTPVGLPKARLEFAPSPADCPPPVTYDVRTEGEASATRALDRWIVGVCTGASSQVVDFTELSSVNGREDFLTGKVDVGITSTSATPDELAAAPGHRSHAYVPLAVTAPVVAYRIYDRDLGREITGLKLSARLVAMIMSNSANRTTDGNFFADPEFLELNPGHAFPASGMLAPLLRAERNADTLLLTGWLDADAEARAFLDGNDPVAQVNPEWKGIDYPTDIFEARTPDTFNPLFGTHALIERLFYESPTRGTRLSRPQNGLVALVDLPTAQAYGLSVAAIENGAGAFVAPTDESLAAGVASMRTVADGTRVPDFDTTDPGAYPLTKIDYAMIPTDGVTPGKAAQIRQFLSYATGAGQAELPEGYLELGDALKREAQAGLDLLPVSAGTRAPVRARIDRSRFPQRDTDDNSPAATDPLDDTTTSESEPDATADTSTLEDSPITEVAGAELLDAGAVADDTTFEPPELDDDGILSASAPVGQPLAVADTGSEEPSVPERVVRSIARALTGTAARFLLPALAVLAVAAAVAGGLLLRGSPAAHAALARLRR